jgi:hypothetical protein
MESFQDDFIAQSMSQLTEQLLVMSVQYRIISALTEGSPQQLL